MDTGRAPRGAAPAGAGRRLTGPRPLLRYLWVAPASAVGLLAAAAALLAGARARVVDGTLEVSGGRLAVLLQRLPAGRRFCAVTLGHVILGRSPELLAGVRLHEQAHVRQYERWGLLFFPLYLLASVAAWGRAGCPYRDNCFEREARHAAGEEGEHGT